MATTKVVIFLVAVLNLNVYVKGEDKEFPDEFLFGVATSAYQVEGAWNESDKGESIWDYLTHNNPGIVRDRSNGDIAADSFHHIDEDVDLLKQLGVNFYRFSISWSRLLPTGFANKVSTVGMRYYQNLLDTLLDNNILPVVTLYHWDLPNSLQKMGGWTNGNMANFFADYAQIAFENFGKKVQYWITFDDPATFCKGYGSTDYAPVNLKAPGIGEYLCIATVLKAHAMTYHLYNDTYRQRQNGKVGIALGMQWYQPNTTQAEDVEAMNRAMQFNAGMFVHPIFSLDGDYPEEVRKAVDTRSLREGFESTRLPVLTEEEVQYIKGTADFLGVNQFSAVMVGDTEPLPYGSPSMEADIGVQTWYNPAWGGSPVSSWLKNVPYGLRNSIQWFNQQCTECPILITANGYSDLDGLDDTDRRNYMGGYLDTTHVLIKNGINVFGYTAWSLMDNFEWIDGYTARFGLFHVNFTDPERPRTIKKSGEYYRDVIKVRYVDPSHPGRRHQIVQDEDDTHDYLKLMNLINSQKGL